MVCFVSFGQTSNNSPFTRFGIGDLVNDEFSSLKGMGLSSAAYQNAYNINIVNPASLSALQAATFEVGLDVKRNNMKVGSENTTLWTGSLQYISLGFPLINPINDLLDRKSRDLSLGMNFLLKPHSLVGYNVSSTDVLPEIGEVERNYVGSGGTYKFMWGNSVKFRNISAGLNIGYLFGQMSYENNVTFVDLLNTRSNIFTDDINLNGFIWNGGLMYKIRLIKVSEDNRRNIPTLTLGVYGNTDVTFNTKSSHLYIGRNEIYGTQDTMTNSTDILGKGSLPSQLGFGIHYDDNNHWEGGISFRTTPWSEYFNEAKEEKLSDTWRLSAGVSYVPDVNSYNNYMERVYYRLGAFYGKDPRSLDGEQADYFGVTLGLGLPFIYQRQISFINTALEFGKSGAANLNETYVKLSVGFTLNDNSWFVKRKFN